MRPSHCYFMLIVLNKGENIKRRLQTIRPDSIPVGFSFYASGKSCGNQCLLLQICHCVIDCFCYCAALSRAVLNVAIRPSAPHLRFSKNTKVVETSNLVEMWCWTRENFRSKGQRSMSLGTVKFVFFFAHIFIKSGPIYVQPRPKWSPAHSIHIVEYISPAKMFRFVIFF